MGYNQVKPGDTCYNKINLLRLAIDRSEWSLEASRQTQDVKITSRSLSPFNCSVITRYTIEHTMPKYCTIT